jgi:hypothetical protein
MTNISIQSTGLNIKSSNKVTIQTSAFIMGTKTELPIKIEADFSTIPEKYHELYLQYLNYKYVELENKIPFPKKEKQSIYTKFINLFKNG